MREENVKSLLLKLKDEKQISDHDAANLIINGYIVVNKSPTPFEDGTAHFINAIIFSAKAEKLLED